MPILNLINKIEAKKTFLPLTNWWPPPGFFITENATVSEPIKFNTIPMRFKYCMILF